MIEKTIQFAKAIADPTRQELMKLLCCEWVTIGQLAEKLNVKQPTVSHHINILNDAGLIHKRKEGKQVFCTLNQEQITMCCGQLMTTFAPNQETVSLQNIEIQ